MPIEGASKHHDFTRYGEMYKFCCRVLSHEGLKRMWYRDGDYLLREG